MIKELFESKFKPKEIVKIRLFEEDIIKIHYILSRSHEKKLDEKFTRAYENAKNGNDQKQEQMENSMKAYMQFVANRK